MLLLLGIPPKLFFFFFSDFGAHVSPIVFLQVTMVESRRVRGLGESPSHDSTGFKKPRRKPRASARDSGAKRVKNGLCQPRCFQGFNMDPLQPPGKHPRNYAVRLSDMQEGEMLGGEAPCRWTEDS